MHAIKIENGKGLILNDVKQFLITYDTLSS